MNTWIIHAHDPLYFGDGRSIGQGTSYGLALPQPSTMAGVVRTRNGSDADGRWVGDPDTARAIGVSGPFGVLLSQSGEIADWWFSAPQDAVLFETADSDSYGELRALRPLSLPSGSACDYQHPVGLTHPDPRKPHRNPARFWRWETEWKPWLLAANTQSVSATWGVQPPAVETRTHVALTDVGVAKDGHLFTTVGRRWHYRDAGGQLQRLGIALRTKAELANGLGQMGGERRVVSWHRSEREFPTCPEAVLKSAEAGAVRLCLVTPAIFAAGSTPTWLLDQSAGAECVGQVSGAYQVISGWDYETKRPKPSRRLVPAGAVFFLRLNGDAAQRRAFVEALWGQAVSDHEQDRRDGFGVCLFGAWDGACPTLTTDRG